MTAFFVACAYSTARALRKTGTHSIASGRGNRTGFDRVLSLQMALRILALLDPKIG